MTIKLLDLFSGIGGFSLGLEQTGKFETVAFCEINEPCRKVLNHHWPEVPCYDDIRDLNAARLRADNISVEAICGGFPCQDISKAGKVAGIEGEKSSIWNEYARLISELRPQVVFVENVATLRGRGLYRVLGDLAEIGYDAEWHCLPASYVGAPHQRDRIWIIAYPQRNQQSRTKSCFGQIGRMGWQFESLAWDRHWETALSEIRGMDDGLPRSVDRTDALRNAIVPQLSYAIGQSYLESATQ